MSLYLGIDASTQSVSALVVDFELSAVVAESSVNFGRDLPHYKAPQGFIPGGPNGQVHANPLMWLEALDLCFERLVKAGASLSRIEAISGAGQQHGTVYLNATGLKRLKSIDASQTLAAQFKGCFSRETSPIWMDTSTSAQCREIESALGGASEVCRRSGSIAIERFSGPQIRRYFQNDPLGYQSTERIHLVSSFIGSILAGTDSPIDHGDGAGMNLLNLKSLNWDPDLLRATAPGLLDKLPPAAIPSKILGNVSSYFASRYKVNPNAKVVLFTGDNPSSLVGMGAAQPGKVVVSLGTSDTFFAAMTDPLTDPAGCGHVFGNPLGGYMTLQCFLNGSLAREKVRDALGMDWAAFDAAIRSTSSGCGGKQMLPFFAPEISPRINLSQPLISGPFKGRWQDDPASARACVEGQFLNMKRRTDWMQLRPDTLFLTGGASQNDSIAQVAANTFNARVTRFSNPGSVALGGAIRSALATGMNNSGALSKLFASFESGRYFEPDPNAIALEWPRDWTFA